MYVCMHACMHGCMYVCMYVCKLFVSQLLRFLRVPPGSDVSAPKADPSAPRSAMSATPATPATRNEGGCDMSATPATRNEGGCNVVPRLPRKMPRRHARPGRAQTRPKRATECHECHACHAKRRWMWDCATPATWNEGGCKVVPHLPRKMPRRHARPGRAQTRPKHATECHECHACHADVTLCHTCHSKCRGVPWVLRLPRVCEIIVC